MVRKRECGSRRQCIQTRLRVRHPGSAEGTGAHAHTFSSHEAHTPGRVAVRNARSLLDSSLTE